MEYSLESAKITSPPNQLSWAQVLSVKPANENQAKTRGHLFAAIVCRDPIDPNRHVSVGIDNIYVGREALNRLSSEYYKNSELSAFSSIGDSVTVVAREFINIYKTVEIAAISYVDGAIYSSAIGGGEIILFRQNMVARLLMSGGQVNDKEKAIAASGYPQQGDVLIATTSALFENYQEGAIRAALQDGDLSAAVGRLSAPSNESMACIFVGFGDVVRPVKMMSQEPADDTKREEDVNKTKSRNFLSKLSVRFPKRPIKLRRRVVENESVRSKKKTTASVGIILLAILVVSIVFGARQKTIIEKREEFENKLQQAEFKVDEALSLYPLNQSKARELFFESQQLVDDLDKQEYESEALTEIKDRLQQNLQSVLGEYHEETETFLDLTLLSDGFTGSILSFDEDKLFVLDGSSFKIASVEIDSKRSEVVSGPALTEGTIDITTYSDRLFELIPPKIYEVDDTSRDEIDDSTSVNSSIRAYAGNIYLLDKTESNIFRYPGDAGSFLDRQEWLAVGIEPNFSNVISWSIDGTIWLLTDDGRIDRYSLGVPANFEVVGVFPEISNPTKLYTNENTDYLYLLEPAKNRVVVIDKEGEYKAQYITDSIKDVVDVVVYEQEGKLILLTGEKLLSLDLKHLN